MSRMKIALLILGVAIVYFMTTAKEHFDPVFVEGTNYRCKNDATQVFMYDGTSLRLYPNDQTAKQWGSATPIDCPPQKQILNMDTAPTFGPTPSMSCKVESFTPF